MIITYVICLHILFKTILGQKWLEISSIIISDTFLKAYVKYSLCKRFYIKKMIIRRSATSA